MSEPYIKSIPHEEDGKLHFVVDQAGYEMFMRLVSRAVPTKADNPANFNAIKDRISGAFLTGAILMGWRGKRG
ncbi:hypothetical protein [Phaeobacter inhibens]|uniref:hypothetical protein n=1 Tax=Phaeobacter inhibens TaxID=221822 RepID=UPI000C99D5FE|nr:hypothetical protein [Phaeobacter inhibens]